MKQKLIELLKENNSGGTSLSISTSLEEYVDKILQFSTIIPYVVQGEIKAFISYYRNDSEGLYAFLTMLLVSEHFQGKGIGRLLLDTAIRDLESSGFQFFSLEVQKENKKAIRLYTNYGFQIKEDKGETWLLEKILK